MRSLSVYVKLVNIGDMMKHLSLFELTSKMMIFCLGHILVQFCVNHLSVFFASLSGDTDLRLQIEWQPMKIQLFNSVSLEERSKK